MKTQIQITKTVGVEAVASVINNYNVRASKKMRELILKMKSENKNYVLAIPSQLKEAGIIEGYANDFEVVKFGVHLSFCHRNHRPVYVAHLYPSKVWSGKQFTEKYKSGIKFVN